MCKLIAEMAWRQKHDRIEIIDKSDAKLWKGRIKGKVGLVARDMVEEDKVSMQRFRLSCARACVCFF